VTHHATALAISFVITLKLSTGANVNENEKNLLLIQAADAMLLLMKNNAGYPMSMEEAILTTDVMNKLMHFKQNVEIYIITPIDPANN
jgi:hypothetical protein